MTLFYINHESGDGSNDDLDLFIWADNPDEAVVLWREYYGLWPDQFPDRTYSVPIHPPVESTALRWHRDVNECDVPTKMAAEALGLVREEE